MLEEVGKATLGRWVVRLARQDELVQRRKGEEKRRPCRVPVKAGEDTERLEVDGGVLGEESGGNDDVVR